jgi:hypothetical protein
MNKKYAPSVVLKSRKKMVCKKANNGINVFHAVVNLQVVAEYLPTNYGMNTSMASKHISNSVYDIL